MSGGLDILALNEEDVTKMLAATTHLGSENVHFQVSIPWLLFTYIIIPYMMRREPVPYYMSDYIDDQFSQLMKLISIVHIACHSI